MTAAVDRRGRAEEREVTELGQGAPSRPDTATYAAVAAPPSRPTSTSRVAGRSRGVAEVPGGVAGDRQDQRPLAGGVRGRWSEVEQQPAGEPG